MKTLLLILLTIPTLLAGELVIVNSPEQELTSNEIKKIYLGKQKRWSDGTVIKITTYEEGELAEAFMKKYLGKKHSQFLLYWKQLLFSGRGVMPHLVSSEEEMIAYIRQTPGAIGYISDSVIDGVSIISITSE